MSAANWKRALVLQAGLLRLVIESEGPIPYYVRAAEACDRALVLWDSEFTQDAEEIARLRARIAMLETAVINRIGHTLRKESTACANDTLACSRG